MTRKELRQLGHTDEQLDEWYNQIIGKHMNLADEKRDTPEIQERRGRFFQRVMQEWQGVHRNPDLPKIGSFAIDDPETHDSMRNKLAAS